MINTLIMFLIIFLIIFTPIAFGAMELWAFSLMELGILLIIILWAIQSIIGSRQLAKGNRQSLINDPNDHNVHNVPNVVVVFLSLFLLLILFQMISLPSGILKIISPNTFVLHSALSFEPSVSSFPLSFIPFLTQIEFFKS